MKRSVTPELLDSDSGTEVATALARVRTFMSPPILHGSHGVEVLT
jgi:hypothetical protein